jgi:hypothetical protein
MLKILALVVGIAALGSAACSAAPGDDAETDQAAILAAEGDFYGDDRVGAILKGHPEKIPADLAAFEATFGVGRACQRADSKEIFVVDESQTRLEGVNGATKMLPRAVITGCNTGDLSDPASARASYTLFAALISDPDMHGAAAGDTVRTWPLEVMALDDKTGLYNFYVFEPAEEPADAWAVIAPGTQGHVTRVARNKVEGAAAAAPTFAVVQRRLTKGEAPRTLDTRGANACFNCHVNGGPLMNEMRDPWTNWVSFKSTLPLGTFSGPTLELVSQAVPNASKGTASLANDLEPIMRAATQEYVFGTKKARGWARAMLAGEQHGGLEQGLRSVFCETELNYGSASQTIPMEVFLDPDAVASADITAPPSYGTAKTPFQFPVRSALDKETESWLIQAKYLTASQVMAIRLLDDENDIFSTARCGLLPEIMKGLTADPSKVQAKVRTVLQSKLAALSFAKTQPKRAAYLKALLTTPAVDTDAVEAEYLTELTARFVAADKSEAAVKLKEAARRAQARKMFPSDANPLPVLDAPK